MEDPVEAADLVQCGHCNKEVAKGNLSMHEVHCQRFLCVCPDCKDLVPKEQLEEHRAEQHTVVICKMCDMKMQRYKLPDHETDECRERPQTCEFCELELPLSTLKEHVVTCGSRTELCPDCKKYITLKDLTKHAQICSFALSEDSYSEKESTYKASGPGYQLQDEQKLRNLNFKHGWSNLVSDSGSNSDNEEKEEPPDLTFSSRQKSQGGGDPYLIHTCPNCHLALPLQTLKWHEEKCKIFESLKLIK